MKTYHFYQKNSSARLTITSASLEESEQELKEILKDTYGWVCEDEDGEDEDED